MSRKILGINWKKENSLKSNPSHSIGMKKAFDIMEIQVEVLKKVRRRINIKINKAPKEDSSYVIGLETAVQIVNEEIYNRNSY